MPRAQRTESAVHEALQRRAGQRPGASFSVKLDAPPHLWLPPYRFHTVVFRSRHVIKHTQASHPHDSDAADRTNFTRALRNALLCPWCSADDEIACRSPVGSRVETNLSPSPRVLTGEILQAPYAALLRRTDLSFRAATERRDPQPRLEIECLPLRA
jgi:hypothetical protein